MVSSRPRFVRRLKSLVLQDFKGVRNSTFDLDADVVLLSGPNGYGKTTVIEALEALFTGDCVDRRAADDRGDVSRLVRQDAPAAVLRCQYRYAQDPVAVDVGDGWAEARASAESGLVSSFRDALGDPRTNWDITRDSAFFYQDGLPGLFGPPSSALSRALVSLVPDPPIFHELLSAVPPLKDTVSDLLSAQRRGKTPDELAAACGAAAYRLQMLAGEPMRDAFKLAKPPGALLARNTVRQSLDNMRKKADLSCDRPTADRATWLPVLRGLAEYARQQGAASAASEGSQPPGDLSQLWGGAATLAEQRRRLESAEAPGSLSDTIGRLEARVAQRRGLLVALGCSPAEHGIGILPLLRSLLALRGMQAATLEEIVQARTALEGFIRKLMPLTDSPDLDAALDAATSLAAEVTASISALENEIASTRQRLGALGQMERTLATCERIDQWLRATLGCTLDSFASADDPQLLDVPALRQAVESAAARPAVDRHGGWAALAEAADTWADRERELEEAQTLESEPHVARLRALEELTRQLQTGDLSTQVRMAMLVEEYPDSITSAVRRLLSRFALHPYLRRHVQVGLDQSKGIAVTFGPSGNGARRDASTLSTGQHNALCIALSVALSLCRKDSMLGFICLDDVSSALDLGNLACDACLIRSLAYVDGPERRQVILSTHHDELTTRLLPLLRPPKGRSLKVIEFTDWRMDSGAQFREWRCVEGTADPRATIELWRIRQEAGASRSAAQ